MDRKIWTQLGLGAVSAVGLAGAACSPADTPEEVAVAEAPAAAPAPAGEAGAAGEGEGGVSLAQAASDPVVYLSALAIAEAHVIAARDAHALGETDAAGEMFAHPVSEVLAEMAPTFEARGVADFTDLFLDASDAAYSGADANTVAARTETILAALRKAEDSAPEDGRSAAQIRAGVVADQIDRAADMYGVAQGSDAYEPYLDGYGFYKAAQSVFKANEADVTSLGGNAVDAIERAMALLGEAYPSAVRPDALNGNAAALKAAASGVQLAVG